MSCLLLVCIVAGYGEIETVQKLSEFNNYRDWGIYRGDSGANQYSELDQINKENVHLLEPVWRYNTRDHTDRSAFQNNPLMIDGCLYIVSPGGRPSPFRSCLRHWSGKDSRMRTFPMNGKQYVVICAGGSPKTPVRSGDAVIAFALPE